MSKTVSLSDEAYDRLKMWKKDGQESFSNEILRILPKRRTPEEFSKIISEIGSISDEDADIMAKSVEED